MQCAQPIQRIADCIPLRQAMQDRRYLTVAELHEDQCYILREKNIENGPGIRYSIVHIVNKTPNGINIKYHWFSDNGVWIDAQPNAPDADVLLVDINDIVALAPPLLPPLISAPKFYHFYDLSLLAHMGGRRMRSQSRKARVRKQKTCRNRRRNNRA
jgi:hypothetical protein